MTGYPDLHTGADALSAIRGRDRLALDLVENPAPVHRAMRQMTALWKWVVDTVSGIILPAGQGTTNWTMGWSDQRFLCIGQNDFTCMISPRMFEEFCGVDTRECCDYVDWAMYHLDGPGALRHVPWLLRLGKKTYRIIQWNLFWAFIYNIVGIALAAFGLLDPIVAAFAMIVSSVFIIFNSRRLNRIR